MNLFNRLLLLILTPVMLFAVSCDVSDSNSAGDKQVAVKMKLATSSSTTAAKQLASTPSTQSIDSLTEVKFLVEELELESAMDEDSLDFEVKNRVVDFPLDGSEFEITDGNVPVGVYDEFEMEIEYDDDANIDDPDFIKESGNDEDDGYSVVIKGIYYGEEFTYKSDEDFELELDLNPPLEVTDTSSPSITVNIDPSGWFKDDSGNDLDPRDSANREQIDENIENSFDAEHEDEDDEDDDDDEDDNDDD